MHDDDSDDSLTPPPTSAGHGLAREAWGLASKVERRMRKLESKFDAWEVHLYGLAGQDEGRLGRAEAKMIEVTHKLENHEARFAAQDEKWAKLDRVHWKIVATSTITITVLATVAALAANLLKLI